MYNRVSFPIASSITLLAKKLSRSLAPKLGDDFIVFLTEFPDSKARIIRVKEDS